MIRLALGVWALDLEGYPPIPQAPNAQRPHHQSATDPFVFVSPEFPRLSLRLGESTSRNPRLPQFPILAPFESHVSIFISNGFSK